MYCKQCGREYRKGAKYCRNCGYKLINCNNSSTNSTNSVSEAYSLTDLINLSLSGDENAFNLLVRSVEPMARFYAKSITNDDYLARESVQLANIQMYRSLSSLKEIESFEGWYKKIVRNKALDLLKKSNKEINFTSLDTDDSDFEYNIADEKIDYQPEKIFDRNERQRMIAEIISSLEENQKAPIMMYFYEGLTIKEIAEELSIPESTVKTRLTAGKKKIKDKVINIQSRYDIKLYSLSPLGFFMYLLRQKETSIPASLLTTTVTTAFSATSTATSNSLLSSIGKSLVAKLVVGTLFVSGTVGTGVYIAKKVNSANRYNDSISEDYDYYSNENGVISDPFFRNDDDSYSIDPFREEIFDKSIDEKGIIIEYQGLSPNVTPIFYNFCDPNTIESKIRYYLKDDGDKVYKNGNIITIVATFADSDSILDQTVYNNETYTLERNEIKYRFDTGIRAITEFDDISEKQWEELYETAINNSAIYILSSDNYVWSFNSENQIIENLDGEVIAVNPHDNDDRAVFYAKFIMEIPRDLSSVWIGGFESNYVPGVIIKIDYYDNDSNRSREYYYGVTLLSYLNKQNELVSFSENTVYSTLVGEEEHVSVEWDSWTDEFLFNSYEELTTAVHRLYYDGAYQELGVTIKFEKVN